MRYPRVLKALGTLLLLFSISLLIPLAGSLYWDEGTAESGVPNPFTGGYVRETTLVFLVTFLATIFFGLFFYFVPREDLEELRLRESYAIVGFTYLMMALLGSVPFLLAGTTRSFTTAFFESMSGLTTTGATALALPLEQYPPSIHLWRGTLQFVGGIGIVVTSISLLQRVTEGAYRLMSMESSGGVVPRIKPKIAQTARTLWGIYSLLALFFFVVYVILMRYTGRQLPWKTAAFDALCSAMTTIATGGFSPRTDSIAFYDSPLLGWVATLFMAISAVNFYLYWLASHGQPGRLFRDGEFRFLALLLFLGSIGVCAGLYWAGRPLWEAIETGIFHTISFATTTGFTTTDQNGFPDSAKFLLVLLMFVGGSTGSTAGGLKVLRASVLFRLSFEEVRRLLHPHAISVVKYGGRVLPEETIRRIVVFFFTFTTVFLIGSLGFLALGFPYVDAVSSAISLQSGVGPAFGRGAFTYHDVPAIGQLWGSILMWLGRLEIFTALLLFVPATYRD